MAVRDEIRYDFQSNRPVKFNIHYHVGSTIRSPVQLDGVTVRADTFVAEVDQSYCLMWTNQGTASTSLKYRVIGP